MVVAVLPADAVTSSLYAPGLTAPGGIVWIGSHLWVSDSALGFCRLDGPNASGTYAINPATCNTSASAPGQASYAADKALVYVPDAAASSQGVWRLTFDPSSETLSGATLLAQNQGLGVARPSAVAIGPDHNLYIVSVGTPDVKRLNNPDGGAGAQAVQRIGGSASGGGVSGLAFVGGDLYLAERGLISVVRNATGCQANSPCDARPTPIVVNMPTALASDGTNVLWFADTPTSTSNIVSFTLTTGAQAVYTSSGVLSPLNTTLFYFATALTLDPTGHLYIGDDPSHGLQPGSGRAWRVTPGVL